MQLKGNILLIQLGKGNRFFLNYLNLPKRNLSLKTVECAKPLNSFRLTYDKAGKNDETKEQNAA